MASFPTVVVDANFGGDPSLGYLILGDTVRGLLGTGRLGPAFAGTDISADVLGVTSRRGRSADSGQFPAATMSVLLDDDDGKYNSDNLSGLYVSSGRSLVTPMVVVRCRVVHNGTTYALNQVFADSWDPSYTKGEAFSMMTGTDGFKVLTRYEPAAASAPVGAGETTGARIGRWANLAGWSSVDRSIDTGESTLAATTLATTPLAGIQATAVAEHGYAYMSADGKLVFRDRHSRSEDTRSVTSQATFGEERASSELHYNTIGFSRDDETIINTVSATRDGGTAQTALNSTSVGRFLTRSENASGLPLETDTETARWAEWLVGRNHDYSTRITGLGFTLVPGDYRFATLLALDIGDFVTVKRRPPDGTTITRYVFVEEIAWSISQGGWTCDLALSPAESYEGFLLGSATRGVLGTDVLMAY